MKETKIETIPAKIEMTAWAKKAAQVLHERASDPQDLNDALLAVHLENWTEEISERILRAMILQVFPPK
jgi:hypothetical protein